MVDLTTGVQSDCNEKAVQDLQDPPSTQEKQMQDPMPYSEVVLVEEEDDPAGSGVPIVEGT